MLDGIINITNGCKTLSKLCIYIYFSQLYQVKTSFAKFFWQSPCLRFRLCHEWFSLLTVRVITERKRQCIKNISSATLIKSLLLTTTMSWEMKTHQIALTLDLYILSHSVEFHILKDLIPL
uniref:Putative ovule protein n=1 Tax=Solanum chacoense TaxID=4108 RepID=A0A0V0HXC2_SOLCH